MEKQQKIYCIPGFGTDEKIFTHLHLNAQLEFINWLHPQKTETLQDYAKRMAAKIQEDNPIIIGVSFGGMLAIEMSKLFPVKKIFIISSVKNRNELPTQYKWAGFLKLNKLFPVKKIVESELAYKIANKRLGAITPEEKEFANQYRRFADIDYTNWSFDKILNWNNQSYPTNITHIHGDYDQIFPIKYVHPTHIIAKGSHMIIYNRADEISHIINQEIKNIAPDMN